MEKEIIICFLKAIEDKLDWIIKNSDVIKNEVLVYLEKIIDILNMLNDKYYENVDEQREIFKEIQATVLLNDYSNALEFTRIKIKELVDGKSH